MGDDAALGWTVQEATIRGEFKRLEFHLFRRAFLNQWISELLADTFQVISESAWQATATAAGADLVDSVAFAPDVTPATGHGPPWPPPAG